MNNARHTSTAQDAHHHAIQESCQRIVQELQNHIMMKEESTDFDDNSGTQEHHWIKDSAIIGEIGLDGLVTGTTPTSSSSSSSSSCSQHHSIGDGGVAMEIQTAVFIAQLVLAFKLGRPVSIHAVKCWPILLDVLECVGLWIGLEPAKKRKKM